MRSRIHKILFALCIITLFIPIVRPAFHILPEMMLSGEWTTFKNPRFSFANYFSLAYQDSFTNYVNHNFSHRPFYIRSYNEINYRLFHNSQSPLIVVGKKDYLFMESSIRNYIGDNYNGTGIIKNNVRLLKKVQDSLNKHNIYLLVMYAPGKATFYAEYLPDKWASRKKDTTNYTQYCSEFKTQQINFIDFNSYFLTLKNKSKFALYPRQGAHWSYYGVAVATDTIIKLIENKRHIKITDFDYSNVELKYEPKTPDYDLGSTLNLFNVLPHEQFPYPVYSYKNSVQDKPAVLVVGDSYWQNLMMADIPKNIFKQDIFWRYFTDEYIDNKKQDKKIKDLNFNEKIMQNDVIIIESSESNYEDFFFNFVDRLNFMFCQSANPRINYWEKEILGNPEWLQSIRQKAAASNRPVDSMLYLDARYMLEQETKK